MNQRERKFWIDSAAGAARNPAAWGTEAEMLKRAADAILALKKEDDARWVRAAGALLTDPKLERPPVFVYPMYLMLAGLALENLLKGIQIARNPQLIQPIPSKPETLFRWHGSGHLTERMFKDAKISLTQAERDLVGRLQTFVEWAGRYPVAKDAFRMAGGAVGYSSDEQLLESLYTRLHEILGQEAAARLAANAADDAVRRREQRKTLLAELETDRYEGIENQGIIQFQTRFLVRP